MKNIIGLCGLIGAGKDTVADYLVNFHEFRRDSFAASLKDAVASVFHWDRELLEGRTAQARAWREQVDPWWAERLGIPNLTPRLVLQLWGTEVCRKRFHNDIWIASLENRLRNSKDNIVISDCRFPNEISAIKNAGGKIVWIKRGVLPAWYEAAETDNKRGTDNMSTRWPDVHPSEWAWIGSDFDFVVSNNSTIDELYKQLDVLIK